MALEETHDVMDTSTMDRLPVLDIIKVFSNPISEEHAWAICFQCTQCFLIPKQTPPEKRQELLEKLQEKQQELFAHGAEAIHLRADGETYVEYQGEKGSGKGPPPAARRSFGRKSYVATEHDAVQALGTAIFQFLDYGTSDHEERQLSPDLESLIELMTKVGSDEDEDAGSQTADEGIEHDHAEEEEASPHLFTFEDVNKCCTRHLSSKQDARHHYKAVCRALFAEARDLITFLEKISKGREKLAGEAKNTEASNQGLEDLDRTDWARLWVQCMRQLRQGVRLKKVEIHSHPTAEYELTPFEMLLEDIRSRRYTLHKIMVNGDIPPKLKNDAHAVILDFIRSRPPLKRVKDRKLKSLPPKKPDPRETLLQEIRSKPTLRPIKGGKLLVRSPRKMSSKDRESSSEEEPETPKVTRKVIKPDFNLFLNSSFSDESEDEMCDKRERRSSLNSPVSPTRDGTWRRAGTRDLPHQSRSTKLQRRHTIMVCESPTDGKVVQKELPPLEEVDESRLSPEAQCRLRSHSLPGGPHLLPPHPHHHPHTLSSRDVPDSGPGVIRRPCPAHPHGRSGSVSSEKRRSLSGLSAIPEVDDRVADGESPSELSATKLLHVSWKTACPRSATNGTAHCKDCRPAPKKWQNPVECLSLTLEEVTHIRSVLTKAELESLITQPDVYSQVSKNKLCFTCKSVKFSLFGEWGTKCKFCKRTVCGKCLRKVNVPSDQFNSIPVYTLSPLPLSPDTKEAIEKFVSKSPTGSMPPTPATPRKLPERRRTLQRSHSVLSKPPTRQALKGPEMSICCECKQMINEIIRTSRTSLALISQGKDPRESEMGGSSLTISRV